MKVIIVGGVAGGATAAARIRRLDEKARVVVYERSGYVSYANCGLPYYIGGVITDPAELTLQTPESFWRRFRIEMKVRHEVQSIDTAKKTVTVKNLNTGEVFQDQYDALLLSPGAKPTQPELPGVDLPELFTLRTVEDTLKIHAFLQEKRPSSSPMKPPPARTAEASSDWSWRRTCGSRGWRSRLSSVPGMCWAPLMRIWPPFSTRSCAGMGSGSSWAARWRGSGPPGRAAWRSC